MRQPAATTTTASTCGKWDVWRWWLVRARSHIFREEPLQAARSAALHGFARALAISVNPGTAPAYLRFVVRCARLTGNTHTHITYKVSACEVCACMPSDDNLFARAIAQLRTNARCWRIIKSIKATLALARLGAQAERQARRVCVCVCLIHNRCPAFIDA